MKILLAFILVLSGCNTKIIAAPVPIPAPNPQACQSRPTSPLPFFIRDRSTHRGQAFVPPNKEYISANSKLVGGIDELSFNKILDTVQAIYTPIFSSVGATFDIERKWEDGTVNAYAYQQGSKWVISMFGGLARYPSMTADGFLLVACHEIGHHLGGAPIYTDEWASVEGQSDYYGVSKCMRRVFHTIGFTPPPESTDEDLKYADGVCNDVHVTEDDQGMCRKSIRAGVSVARLFSDLGGEEVSQFKTPDETIVDATQESHPDAQCRLDTYFHGALCDASYLASVSPIDPKIGYCNRTDGCGVMGTRPLCWYKSNE